MMPNPDTWCHCAICRKLRWDRNELLLKGKWEEAVKYQTKLDNIHVRGGTALCLEPSSEPSNPTQSSQE